MIKRCIFHVPFYIDKNWPSGTNIRPIKLIEAFKRLGFQVDVVCGYGKDRKDQISKIKANIKKGMRYEFVYSESSTEPTLLTEKNHIPKYPLLDFGFLNFLKNNGLKVGLFYRDMYWRFPIYNNVPFLKRCLAKVFYTYDLMKYKKIVDILYLPHKKMIEYSPIAFKNVKIEELPPAVEKGRKIVDNKEKDLLKVFYVGGITGLYDMTELFKAFNEFEKAELTVCCRESEWINCKEHYSKLMNGNIKVIHKSGDEKDEYIEQCDICSLLFEESEYRTFAMPLKLFEYMSYGKPIISSEGTATGEYVRENEVGWEIKYEKSHIINKLEELYSDNKEIKNKRQNVIDKIDENTWDSRARKIITDLS